jgi:hypothetical protein
VYPPGYSNSGRAAYIAGSATSKPQIDPVIDVIDAVLLAKAMELTVRNNRRIFPCYGKSYDNTAPNFQKDLTECWALAKYIADQSGLQGWAHQLRVMEAVNACMCDKGHGGFDPDDPIWPQSGKYYKLTSRFR